MAAFFWPQAENSDIGRQTWPAGCSIKTRLGGASHTNNFPGFAQGKHTTSWRVASWLGTLWSPKGPEEFWLGSSGPSCLKIQPQISNLESAKMCFLMPTPGYA